MQIRAWCLILWGCLCGAMFLYLVVFKATSGDLFAYLIMAMILTASILSVRTGRHQLAAIDSTVERTVSDAP